MKTDKPRVHHTILITADLILDLYEESKKLPENEQRLALIKVKLLSTHIGKEILVEM